MSTRKGASLATMIALVVVVLVLSSLLENCDGSDRCDDMRRTFGPNSNEYRQCLAQGGSGSSGRTSGGSWGGGGHK